MTAMAQAHDRIRSLRGRHAVVDHAIRAVDRHSEVNGRQIAGAVTYFGFLSFFPLLALAFSAVGYISTWFPEAQTHITAAVEDAFPGIIGTGPGQIDIDRVVSAKAGAGLIGLIGLLYAGLGCIDSLRVGLRSVFGTLGVAISYPRKKLVDLGVLLLVGLALLASVAVSVLATDATTYALTLVELDQSVLANVMLKALAVLIGLAVDTVIFAILLTRLPAAHVPWRQLLSGALLAAVGFEVLKLLGTWLVARVTDNPLYATFGVLVGLLIWINFLAQLMVYAAAWTATRPYSLVPAALGQAGAGRSTPFAADTEPLRVVAPADYASVPVGLSGSPSPRRTVTVREVVVGAALGAGLAGLLTRRGTRD